MTLLEFLKSQLSEDTRLGELARDIQKDNDFPVVRNEDKVISYLNFRASISGNSLIVKKLLKAYTIHKDTEGNQLDLDTNFSVLRSENWTYYKAHFPVDKVILVGQRNNFYKAYCIDATNSKALFFDIKSSSSLNDISIVDEQSIHIGNLTEQVSVDEAIHLLLSCNYSLDDKPDENRFNELIEFLKANN